MGEGVFIQVFEGHAEVFGQGAIDIQRFAGDGVIQLEAGGMEGGAVDEGTFGGVAAESVMAFELGEEEGATAVGGIADQGAFGPLRVHTDLVGTAGQGSAFHQGATEVPLADTELGATTFAEARMDGHDAGSGGVGSEGGVDGELGFLRGTLDEGEVGFDGFFRAKEAGELDQDGFGLGEEEDTGRGAIEAVGVGEVTQVTGGGPGHATGDMGMEQAYQVGTIGIVAIRRGQQSGGFIHGQQVIVFEGDGDLPVLAGGGGRELQRSTEGRGGNG